MGIPDTRPVLRAYVEHDEEYFRELASAPDSAAWAETPLDHVNFHFRQQGLAFGQDHWYAYDLETICARLRDAGFVDIRCRDFDPAQDSRPGTLFVVARRP